MKTTIGKGGQGAVKKVAVKSAAASKAALKKAPAKKASAKSTVKTPVRRTAATNPNALTKEELRICEERLGLDDLGYEEKILHVAALLGISAITYKRYRTGGRPVPEYLEISLKAHVVLAQHKLLDELAALTLTR